MLNTRLSVSTIPFLLPTISDQPAGLPLESLPGTLSSQDQASPIGNYQHSSVGSQSDQFIDDSLAIHSGCSPSPMVPSGQGNIFGAIQL